MLGLKARLGVDVLDCDELPSAFDSEDEDELDMDDLTPVKMVADSNGGIGRPAMGGKMKQ